MTMYPTVTHPPYASLISNMKSDSYHQLELNANLQPNQAARIVARVRHQVRLPLVVEIGTSGNKSSFARLARAAAAAGANVILLTLSDFTSAKAILSELYTVVTLPLFVRCPVSGNDQRRQLRTLGVTKILDPETLEPLIMATN